MQSWAHWLWGHCTSHFLLSRCAFNFLFYPLLDFENKLKRRIQYGDADEVSKISPKDLTKCNSNALFMAMKVRECRQFQYTDMHLPFHALKLSWVQIGPLQLESTEYITCLDCFFLTNQVLGCAIQNTFTFQHTSQSLLLACHFWLLYIMLTT